MKPLIPENTLPKNCRKINNEHAYLEYLNMKKLKKKVIATKDKKFINKIKSTLKDYEIEF